MADEYQSSDQVKTVANRQMGASVFERTLFINTTELTQLGTSPYWIGYAQLPLDEFSFNTLVPEFSVVMTSYVRVDGEDPGDFIYYWRNQPLPINEVIQAPVGIDTDADIGKLNFSASAFITYISTDGLKQDTVYGTSVLNIEYIQRRLDSGRLLRFDVKIKGSDSITA